MDPGSSTPYQVRVKSQACPSGEAGSRKYLGDDAEPRWPLQLSLPLLAAWRVPWDLVSRTMLSSPIKSSQVYVLRSCISLPEWLVGPAGSVPRSKEHGQGLGFSQFPGQSCTPCPSWQNRKQRWLEVAAAGGIVTLAHRP